MNRVLVAALVATAVVGATSGTVVARSLDRTTPAPAGTVATDGTDPATPDGVPPRPPAPGRDDRADEVLWASTTEVHDGDTVVELEQDLDTDGVETGLLETLPTALQRTADGWVLYIGGGIDPGSTNEVFAVSPDGTVRSLAEVAGTGDVSPDGTRFVAQDPEGPGYTVWDVASGEVVGTVPRGRTAGQRPAGRAQWVSADSVATSWSGGDGAGIEVVRGVLGSDEQVLVADDLYGPFVVSPDGRWLAGTLAEVDGGAAVSGCVVVRPVDRSGPGRTDCGGEFIPSAGDEPVPTFASDSSALLTATKGYGFLGDPDFGDTDFRPVPTGDGRVPPAVPAPRNAEYAVFLGPGEVAALGTTDPDTGEGTQVHRCSAERGCRLVASSADDTFHVRLGTAY